jgi:hydroxypyruvate isomerase
MNRRSFFSLTAASVAATAALAGEGGSAPTDSTSPAKNTKPTLNYAPHFGMFSNSAGKNPIDQLKFAADQGFTAWEDNEMKDRPVALQEKIASTMRDLGMQMGVISALRGVWNAVNFGGGETGPRDAVLRAMTGIVDVAKRTNAKFLTVVPGLANPKLEMGYQTASCIELLKRCCDILAPHDLVMVLEPLNRKTNHPGVFLSGSPQAYQICRAVDHPSCKILFDIYHQQVTEGNLIPNINRCWGEIAYFQSADNPGRNEPGTGEINYQNVFRHLHRKGYRGIIGMEHGNSRRGAEGERAVIAAYRRVDPSGEKP